MESTSSVGFITRYTMNLSSTTSCNVQRSEKRCIEILVRFDTPLFYSFFIVESSMSQLISCQQTLHLETGKFLMDTLEKHQGHFPANSGFELMRIMSKTSLPCLLSILSSPLFHLYIKEM